MSGSLDDDEELRREMESHLAQLEDDARRTGASPQQATRDAEERFGSAADHFRSALDEWTRKQRSIRNGLIGIALSALVVSAAGIVINVRLLRELRITIDGWSERAKSTDLEIGAARYVGALVETVWSSPHGLVRLELPMLKSDWERETARLPQRCPEGEAPRFEFAITEEVSAHFPGVPVGATMFCRLKRAVDLDWYVGAAPTSHSEWLRAVGSSLRFAGCSE